jgi:hypothetical protein
MLSRLLFRQSVGHVVEVPRAIDAGIILGIINIVKRQVCPVKCVRETHDWPTVTDSRVGINITIHFVRASCKDLYVTKTFPGSILLEGKTFICCASFDEFSGGEVGACRVPPSYWHNGRVGGCHRGSGAACGQN